MRHASRSGNLNPQRPFRSQRDAVLGRFAVDQILACMRWLTRRELIGRLCAQTVALFAHHKQQSDVNTLLAQPFRGRDLRRDNAFGVAGASPVNAANVFG
jgi:hypothetical protein